MAKQKIKQELIKENKTMDSILGVRANEIKLLKLQVDRLERENENLEESLRNKSVQVTRLNGQLLGLEQALTIVAKNRG